MKLFICPIVTCRAENDLLADTCVKCRTPLIAYKNLSILPAQVFNDGLTEVCTGRISRARDLFAAVVYWCPNDIEARNAFAMACFALRDYAEARHQWEIVLAQTSRDKIALKGIDALHRIAVSEAKNKEKISAKRRKKKKRASIVVKLQAKAKQKKPLLQKYQDANIR